MTSSLTERLAHIAAEENGEEAAQYRQLVAFLDRVGLAEQRLRVGDMAPDFALPSQEFQTVTLASLLAQGPQVLVFLRGTWCPYCREQVATLVETADAFAADGLGLVVVTPETGGRADEFLGERKLPFAVLCDVGMGCALAYGCLFPVPAEHRDFLLSHGIDLAERSGTGAWFMPLASTFGIGRNGRILGTFGGTDPRHRPDPEDVIANMQAALAEAREVISRSDQP